MRMYRTTTFFITYLFVLIFFSLFYAVFYIFATIINKLKTIMDTKSSLLTLLIIILVITLILVLYIQLCRIPAKMAKNKGRSFNGWFWFSFLTSPFLGIIIVACLSETEKKRLQRIIEEEEIRQKIAKGDINTNNISNYKSVHDMYRKTSSSVIDK